MEDIVEFPLIFRLNLHVHEQCEVNKVEAFLKQVSSNDLVDDPYFVFIPVDNTIIRVKFWYESTKYPSLQPFVCFYNHQQISKALVLKEWRDMLDPKCDFDDTLALFVGIRHQNTQFIPDIGPQLQVPNVRFVEWCVNSNAQDARGTLQDFIRKVVIKTFFNTVGILYESTGLLKDQDEDRQMFLEDIATKRASWSLDCESSFSIILQRYLDLIRMAISYNAPYYRFAFRFCMSSTLSWSSSGWSHVQLATCENKADDSVRFYCLNNCTATHKLPVSSASHPVSILATRRKSHLINTFFKSQEMDVFARDLVIRCCDGKLDLYELTLQLKSLVHLVIDYTTIDVTNLGFPTQFCETMKHLVMVNCGLTQVPQAVGSLIRLTFLNISQNKIYAFSGSLGNLRELRTFLYEDCPIEFPPMNVLKRPAQDVIKYLQAFQHDDESVPHNEAKLIVAGQEGVGKSTLIKGLQRNFWTSNLNPPDKTDGVDIKTLQLRGTRFLVYDLAGDVEYLNTHPLFLSSQCLHLVVFDISQILVGKGTRSVDQLCRLELWLKMIAAQHPKSYVIMVGTHADHERITTEIISSIRKQIIELLERYRTNHTFHNEYFDKCILCNIKVMPQELHGIQTTTTLDDIGTLESCVPHILGYFEVSSVTKYPPAMLSLTNKNLESLKSAIASSNFLMTNAECRIPKTWLSFYETLKIEMKPTASFSEMCFVAEECDVPLHMVESMLRFFHSQGNLLWYEDIPEMKEVIITDPHWLSDQLRTLISYRPSVNAVCDGILHTPSLSVVWPDMREENRQKLLALFRSVSLCFSISGDKELFPCNLPIGWPDRHKWPPLPNKDESQTSLLLTFTFLPPTFFSKLIVEVNKRRASFPVDVEPLYFRFHILYVTKENIKCDMHKHESQQDVKLGTSYHKVHYEIMPHRNTMKVFIRGPSPCCFVSDVRSTVKGIQSCYYPGITFDTHLVCPLCEMNKVDDPAIFSLTSPKLERLICSKSWHVVGSISDILQGMYSRPETDEMKRTVGETLEDYYCPKLFVVLPINIDCLSLKDRIAYSYIKDGYAVHLLCECPDEPWHFVDSPGFRIAKPKAFLEKYGKHLCTVLKAISKLGTPLRLAAAADPLCKTGAAVASGVASFAKELDGFLENVFEKYPQLKSASYQDLGDLKTSSGLQRSELAKFLETVTKGREFGPLVFTYVDKCGEWLWLCEDHHRRFSIVNK